MQKLPLVLLVIGCVIGGFALLFGFQLFPILLRKKISEQGRLINGTDKWKSWEVVPIPIYQKLYIFNVTNPNEAKKGEKPILVELGPYVYEQRRSKVDISINEDDDTIFYRHHDKYYFKKDMSNGKLSDQITVLNMPYLGTVAKSLKMGTVSRYLVSTMFADLFPDEELYVHITVDEFLFGGYYVPFMQELSEMKGEVLLPNNTFGLYYNRNGSESLMYEIYSGVKEPSRFGQVASYDSKKEVNLWNDEYCDKINGSDGTTFAPFLTPEREFYLFAPTMCRNMKFAYDSDTTVMDINAYRYTIPEDYLADPRTNPETRCYCLEPGENYENCLRHGVWDLSACKQGTPLVMSFPHFYMGSEYYLNQTIGLRPVKDEHEMLVVVEPTTAISLRVHIRVQMNMAIKPSKYFPALKNVKEIVHPIFWMEQGASIDEEKAQLMKDKLFRTQEIVRLGTYGVFAFGCLLVAVAIAICICCSGSDKTKQYSPRKASLSQTNSFETGDTFLDPPMKSDWSKLSPDERYSVLKTPPTVRISAEEQPFLASNAYVTTNHQSYSNPPNRTSTPTPTPAIRTSSPPVVVAVYPKLLSQDQPRNSPFQHQSADEVDDLTNTNNKDSAVVSRRMNTIDPPFPQKNEFSSTLSMNSALEDMNNTLNNIQDTLSSYENL